MMAKKIKVDKKTPEGALVLLEEKWSEAFPEEVKEVCKSIFMARCKKNDHRQDSIREARTFALKMATFLLGLLEMGQVTTGEISAMKNEGDVLDLIRKKLGFYTFEIMLRQDAKKGKYLAQAGQEIVWKELNSLQAEPKHRLKMTTATEYVSEYKKLLTSMKARMFLAEIIDENVTEKKQRSHFFYQNSRFHSDGKERMNYRSVFGYIIITSYTATTGKDVKALQEYVELKKYCEDKEQVEAGIRKFIFMVLKNEKMCDAVLELPELKVFNEKFYEVVSGGTVRNFISYLGNDETTHDRDIWEYTEKVARWIVYYGSRDNVNSKMPADYYSLPKVSRALRILCEAEFFYILNTYPYLAVFLNRYDVMYYLMTEKDDAAREKVFKFIEPSLIHDAENTLDSKYSVRDFMLNYLNNVVDGDLSVVTLARAFSRPEERKPDFDKSSRRASNYIIHALSEFNFEETISLLLKYVSLGVDINEVLPESIRAYLWYIYKDLETKPMIINCPDLCMNYIEPEDIKQYMAHRRRAAEIKQIMDATDELAHGKKNREVEAEDLNDENIEKVEVITQEKWENIVVESDVE